jgi:hypothetical protein
MCGVEGARCFPLAHCLSGSGVQLMHLAPDMACPCLLLPCRWAARLPRWLQRTTAATMRRAPVLAATCWRARACSSAAAQVSLATRSCGPQWPSMRYRNLCVGCWAVITILVLRACRRAGVRACRHAGVHTGRASKQPPHALICTLQPDTTYNTHTRVLTPNCHTQHAATSQLHPAPATIPQASRAASGHATARARGL